MSGNVKLKCKVGYGIISYSSFEITLTKKLCMQNRLDFVNYKRIEFYKEIKRDFVACVNAFHNLTSYIVHIILQSSRLPLMIYSALVGVMT